MSALNSLRKRTSLEKFFIVTFFLLLLIIIIILSAIILKDQIYHGQEDKDKAKILDSHLSSNSTNNGGLCLNSSCIRRASSLLNAIDSSVKPCDDFYHFSCGNWIKSNSIPDGAQVWSRSSEVNLQNQLVMKEIVESPSNVEKEGSTEWKIKQFYWSCMNRGGYREVLDIKPILPLVTAIHGWTISTIGDVKFNESAPWDFQDLLERLHSLFDMDLIEIGMLADFRNPSTNMIAIAQNGILDKDLLENKTDTNLKMQAYKTYMFELGMLLGGSENYTRQCVEEVIDFKIELIKISESPLELAKHYSKLTISNVAQLQKDYPFINWLEFLNTILNLSNISINSTEKVRNMSPNYFRKLTLLIEDMVKTTKGRRTIQNYGMWSLLMKYAPKLSNRFREVKAKYTKTVKGIVGEEEEWKKCLKEVKDNLGFGLGAMFVRKKFKPESKISMTEIIQNIKKAFISNLPSLSWMDQTTRTATIQKANAMQYKIGYPDFILNNTLLDAFYQEFHIQENKYFDNIMSIMEATTNRSFSKLRSINDMSDWDVKPSVLNALYYPNQNQMFFTAAILQGCFFDNLLPDWANYGSIGFVAGHELTHGFDDNGSLFDSKGMMRKWWDDKIKEQFDNRTQCLIDQYSKYKVDGEKLNGKLTLGENIADNGGLKSAYNAYISLNKNEPTLPGVDFNHKQLFFISMAQVWCEKKNKAARKYQIRNDDHSLGEFRVIGSVSNFPEFSTAFNCPLDSPMNPRNKCEVW